MIERSTPKRIADQIATFLRGRGVTTVYGLPGGETLAMLDAIRSAGIRFVLVHHETTAGFAADVTGQLTGIPGVCLATVGPGAVNLVAGAASATLERSPALCLTAEIDPSLRDRITHMKLNQGNLFGATTKGSLTLTQDNAVRILHDAWALALSPPRGAVHLAISPQVASAPAIFADLHDQRPAKPTIDSQGIESARRYLKEAQRVILLAGLGVEAGDASAGLLSLSEAWNVPVSVTPKAKGQFPEDHPLFVGCFSAYGDQPLREALNQADLILGVGLDGIDFVTSTWDIATPLINLNLGGADDPTTRPVLAIDGGLRESLATLQACRNPDPDGPRIASRLRRQISEALDTYYQPAPGSVPMLELIQALQVALPPDGAVTVDVGAFKLVFLLEQVRNQLPVANTEFNSTDWASLARAFDLQYRLIDKESGVVEILQEALSCGSPILVEARIDPQEYLHFK